MGINPDYSLIIHGYGEIIYEGENNVKISGEITDKIDKDKISLILSKFKEIDFFSLDDIYPVKNAENRPYTIISISITDENNNVIEKGITHYHGDKKVPRKLINLEDTIDEVVGSDKWIKGKEVKTKSLDRSDIKGEKHLQDILEKHKRKSYLVKQKRKSKIKKITISIFTLVIIMVLVYFLMSQLVNESFFENDDSINDNGSKTPIIMSAKDYVSDKNIKKKGYNVTRLFSSLDDGDILIIKDTIDNIIYRAIENYTIITFNFNIIDSNISTSSTSFSFEGNLRNKYSIGDKVKITVTILHVYYENQGSFYDIDAYYFEEEIFKEQWPGKDQMEKTGNYLPLPQKCIEIV